MPARSADAAASLPETALVTATAADGPRGAMPPGGETHGAVPPGGEVPVEAPSSELTVKHPFRRAPETQTRCLAARRWRAVALLPRHTTRRREKTSWLPSMTALQLARRCAPLTSRRGPSGICRTRPAARGAATSSGNQRRQRWHVGAPRRMVATRGFVASGTHATPRSPRGTWQRWRPRGACPPCSPRCASTPRALRLPVVGAHHDGADGSCGARWRPAGTEARRGRGSGRTRARRRGQRGRACDEGHGVAARTSASGSRRVFTARK